MTHPTPQAGGLVLSPEAAGPVERGGIATSAPALPQKDLLEAERRWMAWWRLWEVWR